MKMVGYTLFVWALWLPSLMAASATKYFTFDDVQCTTNWASIQSVTCNGVSSSSSSCPMGSTVSLSGTYWVASNTFPKRVQVCSKLRVSEVTVRTMACQTINLCQYMDCAAAAASSDDENDNSNDYLEFSNEYNFYQLFNFTIPTSSDAGDDEGFDFVWQAMGDNDNVLESCTVMAVSNSATSSSSYYNVVSILAMATMTTVAASAIFHGRNNKPRQVVVAVLPNLSETELDKVKSDFCLMPKEQEEEGSFMTI